MTEPVLQYRRQRQALLLHAGLFGLPHALIAVVVVALCLRDVFLQYGGPGEAPAWAVAWFGCTGVVVVTWLTLALRGWRGGHAALAAAACGYWLVLLLGLAATAVAWTGLVRAIFHLSLFDADVLIAWLVLLPGIPLLSCTAHLLWLRRRGS